MMRSTPDLTTALDEVSERLTRLEHAADLIKTVLMVREPETIHAANAYDGLRKQIVAASGERRSHLGQLTAMAVALSRATDVADLRPQVKEWLRQASIEELRHVPKGHRAQELFESCDGGNLEGETRLEVLEPAYLDSVTGVVLRLGRARALDVPVAGPEEKSEALT
jgi:hypothetical protein